MKKLLLLIALCYWTASVLGQTRFGVGLDLFQSTLVGVGTGKTTLSGFSGVPHTAKKTIGGSFDLIAQSKLKNRLEIEYGIGYFHENEEIHFDQAPTLTGLVSAMLNIDLHYLESPVQLNYILHGYSKKGLVLGIIGLSPKLLIRQKDNYNEIIVEQISLSQSFSQFMLSGNIGIGFRQFFSNEKYAELFIYQEVDLTQFVKGGWGFYNDLSTSGNRRLGIKLRYYFLNF